MVGPDDQGIGTYPSPNPNVRTVSVHGQTVMIITIPAGTAAAADTMHCPGFYCPGPAPINELARLLAPLRDMTKALGWIPNQREAHGGLPPPLPIPLPPLNRPIKLLDVRRIIRTLYTKRITPHGP